MLNKGETIPQIWSNLQESESFSIEPDFERVLKVRWETFEQSYEFGQGGYFLDSYRSKYSSCHLQETVLEALLSELRSFVVKKLNTTSVILPELLNSIYINFTYF